MKMRPKGKRIPSKKIISIPSKFETILKDKEDNKRGFGSSSKRFETADDIKSITNSNNTFNADDAINNSSGFGDKQHKSFESNSASYSSKGYGNGFISRTKRFNVNSSNYLCSQCKHEKSLETANNSIFNDKHSRSTSFSKSRNSSHTAYFESFIKQSASNPGPGAYSSRSIDDLYHNYKDYRSSFSSKSKRYFDSIISNHSKHDDQQGIVSVPIRPKTGDNMKKNEINNRNKKVPFNTSEKRFEDDLYNDKNHSKYIDDVLFKQSQFVNSRSMIPFDSRKRVISRIAKEKSSTTDSYYYNNEGFSDGNTVSRVIYKTPINSARSYKVVTKHTSVPNLRL